MDNKPGKRKSRMNNIQSRMISGAYNMAKFKANEKDLREKIAFFEKKEEKGELKDYMFGRLEEAREMYARLLALKSGEPVPAAPVAYEDLHLQAPETIAAANNERDAVVESLFPGTLSSIPAKTSKKTTVPKMTLKKLNKQRREAEATALATSYAQPEFNPPPPSPAALPAPYGHYNNSGQFRVNGTVAPTYNLGANAAPTSTTFNNIATYQTAVQPTLTTRRQRTPVPIYNEYYEQAVPQFLPLPELYDPYSGRKFQPEEDPMPPIESAYHELKAILKRAHLKAASLRRKAKRATARKAKNNKRVNESTQAQNSIFNQGLRIRIPPNRSTRKVKRVQLPPTGQTLD